MTEAKSGRPGRGVGEVFVEIAEKTRFPRFRFFRTSEDRELAGYDTLQRNREPKHRRRLWRPL